MKKIKNKSAGIILSSLFMVLLLAPLSQAQIPPGPLSDLLMYYANMYSSRQNSRTNVCEKSGRKGTTG